MIRVFSIFVMAALLAFASQARAALITISGSGTFGSASNLSGVYVPNAPFAFSFQVDNPLTIDPLTGLPPILNPSYTVGGAPAGTIVALQFFDLASGGLFDLGFAGDELTFAGPDIGSSGVVSSGSYTGAVFGDAQMFGSASITVAVAAVPLPPTMAMFGSGLIAVVAIRQGRRIKRRALVAG